MGCTHPAYSMQTKGVHPVKGLTILKTPLEHPSRENKSHFMGAPVRAKSDSRSVFAARRTGARCPACVVVLSYLPFLDTGS